MNNADPGTQTTVTDASAGTIQARRDTMAPAPASGPPASDAPPAQDQLPGVRAEFPCFRIWREVTCDRARYMSRSLHLRLNPHTVMTDDIAELHAALEPARHEPCPEPHPPGRRPRQAARQPAGRPATPS